MSCGGRVGEVESAYLAALGEVETIRGAGNTLVLEGPDVYLRYERARRAQTAQLVDRRWVLEAIVRRRRELDSATAALLTLASDGSIYGSSGCGFFTGTWEVAGSEIAVSDWELHPNCRRDARPRLKDQEQYIIGVLARAFTVSSEGATLIARRVGSVIGLRYRPR